MFNVCCYERVGRHTAKEKKTEEADPRRRRERMSNRYWLRQVNRQIGDSNLDISQIVRQIKSQIVGQIKSQIVGQIKSQIVGQI